MSMKWNPRHLTFDIFPEKLLDPCCYCSEVSCANVATYFFFRKKRSFWSSTSWETKMKTLSPFYCRATKFLLTKDDQLRNWMGTTFGHNFINTFWHGKLTRLAEIFFLRSLYLCEELRESHACKLAILKAKIRQGLKCLSASNGLAFFRLKKIMNFAAERLHTIVPWKVRIKIIQRFSILKCQEHFLPSKSLSKFPVIVCRLKSFKVVSDQVTTLQNL
jgi:hypothetical protein